METIPILSHLQVAVLRNLLKGQQSSRELRAVLAKQGTKKSGPAFYQLMGRMEKSGLIEGAYSQTIVDKQIVRERIYRISAKGATQLRTVFDFYSKH